MLSHHPRIGVDQVSCGACPASAPAVPRSVWHRGAREAPWEGDSGGSGGRRGADAKMPFEFPIRPRVIIPEKLTSDGAAKRESLPGVEHGQSRSLNNRCEHSPCFTRQRAYRM